MTLTELVQEVYTITNRPTLTNETVQAVKAATLFIHQKENLWRDLEETVVAFNASGNYVDIDLDETFPRFRALSYLRKMDGADGSPGSFIALVSPQELINEYGRERQDVAYAAGRMLRIKSSTVLSNCLIGYYRNPNVTSANYYSWIAAQHPFAIIYGAAERVFKMIGKTEEFAAYKELYLMELNNVIMSGVRALGE